jgi:5'-nucleotidase/UDP-sugar diphosphatase
VSIYLTGKEIKAMAEVDATVSPKMPEARLYFSGLEYAFNDRRLFLNRAIDMKLVREDGTTEKLKNDQLYRVVGGLYSTQMLGTVEEASKGFLPITPKDKDGEPIKDFEEHIIYGSRGEVKEWYALASYIDASPNNKLPEAYKEPQGRKVNKTGFNPYTLLKQPNNFGLIVGAAVLIPIVIIVGIVLWFRKRRHVRRGYGRSMFKKKTKRQSGKPVFKERRIPSWRRRNKGGHRRF